MASYDDIDKLKVHKIAPRTRDPHVALPMLGQSPTSPSQPPSEAFAEGVHPVEATADIEALHAKIIAALKTIFDPEIPVNIHELGLIYGVEVSADGAAEVKMTLTAPACPVAGALVQEVADKVGHVDGVKTSHVELVWDPPWTPDRMTEAAKLELGFF